MWVYIVAGVAATVLFLLFLPVTIRLRYENELEIRLYWFLVKYTIIPRKPVKKAKIKKKEQFSFSRLKKGEGSEVTVKQIFHYISKFFETFSSILSKGYLDVFEVNISVGGSDPANAAISYGGICGLTFTTYGFLLSNVRHGKSRLIIVPDVNSQDTRADINIKFSICLILAIIVAIKFIIKLYERNEVQNAGSHDK